MVVGQVNFDGENAMSEPVVSIVMPVYNGEDTISFAISSLLAQTYTKWECLVVDDGSTDSTFDIVSSFNDNRITIYRFNENKGRPFARQYALGKASGQFIAMLDADDWIFTDKLELQVQQFLDEPSLVAVSAGLLITGKDGPIGVRFADDGETRFLANPMDFEMPHASTMLRMDAAKICDYDLRLKYSQDTDFLRKVIFLKKYKILPIPLYCYSEFVSVRPVKVLRSYMYGCLSHLHWFGAYPLPVIFKVFKNMCKATLVAAFSAFGLFSMVLRHRSKPVSPRLKDEYHEQLRQVKEVETKAKQLAVQSSTS